jgi:sugar lactone lactonase YvrE
MESLMKNPDVTCVVNEADQLGETPLWCERTQKLWWLDIERPRLQSFDPSSGRHDVFTFDSTYAGSLAICASGGFLVALDNDLFRFDPDTRALEKFVTVEPKNPATRLNDGRCDRQGRFWVGTMDNGLSQPRGSLYRVDPSGVVTRADQGFIVSNSLTTSPDGRTLYFSDTRKFVMWAFDLDVDSGNISNRRVFFDHSADGSRPDGACVDADGCVWNAIFAGSRIVRYSPAGKIDRTIALPVTNPTCLCFGGADYSTLYVTSATKMIGPEMLAEETLAGAVLALDVGVRGLPEAAFRI